MMPRSAWIIALMLSLAPPLAESQHLKVAPVVMHAKGVSDLQGRLRYIILLEGAAPAAFPDLAPTSDDRARFGSRVSSRMISLTKSFEAQYGFSAHHITSTAANGIVAYLSLDQVDRLSRDPLVKVIEEDGYVKFAGAPWTDAPVAPNMTQSWGRVAVHGTLARRYAPYVYVIDAGVGYHDNLGSVMRRESPATMNTASTFDPYYVSGKNYLSVGCYPHATHVAGIIASEPGTYGATAPDGGTLGVVSGAPIISLSVSDGGTTNGTTGPLCEDGADSNTSNISEAEGALDYLKDDATSISPGRAVVANISLESPSGDNTMAGPTFAAYVSGAATPSLSTGYGGAFIAIAAGNYFVDACNVTYAAAASSDGVMVVGGLDSSGHPVVPPTPGGNGFVNDPSAAQSQPGSNYGRCVDVWAPAQQILSSWADNPQFDNVTYTKHQLLSGTSMAAPHVAAIAAASLQIRPDMSPGEVEANIRARLATMAATDAAGIQVRMAVLPTAVPTIAQLLLLH